MVYHYDNRTLSISMSIWPDLAMWSDVKPALAFGIQSKRSFHTIETFPNRVSTLLIIRCFDFAAFMEPDRLQKRFNSRRKRSSSSIDDTPKKRSKREAPYVIYPEILVIVDYDGYRYALQTWHCSMRIRIWDKDVSLRLKVTRRRQPSDQEILCVVLERRRFEVQAVERTQNQDIHRWNHHIKGMYLFFVLIYT